MKSMTLKQFARHRFFELCRRNARLCANGLSTKADQIEFVIVSVQLHAAKGEVPKYLWKYANPDYYPA